MESLSFSMPFIILSATFEGDCTGHGIGAFFPPAFLKNLVLVATG